MADPDRRLIDAAEREARLELQLQNGSTWLAWFDTGIVVITIATLAVLAFLVADMVAFAGHLGP